MYSKPNLTAPSSLSNFAFESCTSKCFLDAARNVEKYILINRLSTVGAKWVNPIHFMPIIRQNSLMENLPRSSPTSNHRASPTPEWSVKRITMLCKICPAQPSVFNFRNFLMHGCWITPWYCRGDNHSFKFLQVSTMLMKVFIFVRVISVFGTCRT